MKTNTLTIIALVTGVALAAFAHGDVDTSKLPPPSDKKDVTYEKDIKPIFEASCVKCHSGEKPKAKLSLDTLENVLKGTPKEKVVIPGDSAKSELVHSVGQLGEEDHWMPPPDNKAKIPPLTKEEIGLIRAWIDQGAK